MNRFIETCGTCKHMWTTPIRSGGPCFWCMRMWAVQGIPQNNPEYSLFVYWEPVEEPDALID